MLNSGTTSDYLFGIFTINTVLDSTEVNVKKVEKIIKCVTER